LLSFGYGGKNPADFSATKPYTNTLVTIAELKTKRENRADSEL